MAYYFAQNKEEEKGRSGVGFPFHSHRGLGRLFSSLRCEANTETSAKILTLLFSSPQKRQKNFGRSADTCGEKRKKKAKRISDDFAIFATPPQKRYGCTHKFHAELDPHLRPPPPLPIVRNEYAINHRLVCLVLQVCTCSCVEGRSVFHPSRGASYAKNWGKKRERWGRKLVLTFRMGRDNDGKPRKKFLLGFICPVLHRKMLAGPGTKVSFIASTVGV